MGETYLLKVLGAVPVRVACIRETCNASMKKRGVCLTLKWHLVPLNLLKSERVLPPKLKEVSSAYQGGLRRTWYVWILSVAY